MGNYRGGYAGESKYGEELVKKINEGNTEAIRDRNRMQNVILAGVKTGLVGGVAGGNVLWGNHLKNVAQKAAENKAYMGIKAREARAMTAQQAFDDAKLRQSAEPYKAPEYSAPDNVTPPPTWLNRAQGLPPDAEAGEALDRQQANDARQQADTQNFRGSGMMGSAPTPDEDDPYWNKG